jgi:hypothetical protein
VRDYGGNTGGICRYGETLEFRYCTAEMRERAAEMQKIIAQRDTEDTEKSEKLLGMFVSLKRIRENFIVEQNFVCVN